MGTKTERYRAILLAPGRPLPLAEERCDTQADIKYYSALMLSRNPHLTGARVEVVLQTGFAHGRPCRWRYEAAGNMLVAIGKYDKYGGTPVFEGMTGADTKVRSRQ